MKRKHSNREIIAVTYRRLKAFFYFSAVMVVLGLAANGVFFALAIFGQRAFTEVEWYLVLTSEAIALAFGIIFVFSYRRIRVLEVQLAATAPFFSRSLYIWPKDLFESSGARFLNKKKIGLIVSLHIRGLESEIVSFYGQEELKAINTYIFEAIQKHFEDGSRYHYGFTMMNDILILSAGQDQTEFYKEVSSLTEDILARISETGKVVNISILYGGAFYRKGDSIREVVDHAIAASRFNEGSRFSNEVALYSEEQKDAADSEKSMPSEIMEGIAKEQFQIYYQPKFDLNEKKFLGAEALVRWNHPTRGLLPPSFFIPFSERSGLITVLDHYIFERVMSDMEKWLAQGEYVPRVSINISRRTIYDKGVIRFLKEAAVRHHVPPSLLSLMSVRIRLFLSQTAK